MQTTNSTVEILLIENIQAGSVQIERNLSLIRSNLFRLTKAQNCDELTNYIGADCLDLIFYILDSTEQDSLIARTRIRQTISEPIPIIFFTEKPLKREVSEANIAENYIFLSDISPSLLESTIYFALEQEKSSRELKSIKQENIALSSQLLATKNLFQTIVDNTSTLVWMCDAAGNTTFFNQAWSRTLGPESNSQLANNWLINIHPLDRDYCEQKFKQALAKQKGFTINYRLINLDSCYRWISNYAVPQFTVDGQFQGLVGYCFDITAHKKTEQKLIQRAASDRLLAQITQKIHTSLHLDRILQTTVDEVKQFLLAEKIQINLVEEKNQLTLLFESRLVGSPLSCDITEPKEVPVVLFEDNIALLSAGKSVTQDFADCSTAKKSCSTLLIPIICEAKLWGLICIENCSFARSWNVEEIYLLERVAMVLSVAIKQSKLYQQLEQANHELQHLSVMDGLTHIANRRKFDQYIAAEWQRLSREQAPLSLILCDIDCFKLYNDTYGHQAGDRCLIEVAQAIQKTLKRPTDLLARYGGEEFVLVLPRTPLAGAKYLAQQARLQVEALKIPHLRSSVDLYVTISLGVASCIPSEKTNFKALVAAADQGLYLAKAKGRNRTVECEIELE
ncbi:MAG: diguanylate cyclase [Cyanobacteria bacterium J06607_15]